MGSVEFSKTDILAPHVTIVITAITGENSVTYSTTTCFLGIYGYS